MRKLAVLNQKGGVGKTTTAATLATIWAREGRRVLAVDMDPQGNLGLMLGVLYDPERPTVYEALTSTPAHVGIRDAVMPTKDGVDLVPATTQLDRLQLENSADAVFRLREALDELDGDYDICVIDCPPTTQSIFARQALMAADQVLVPTNAELCSVAGLAQLFASVGEMSGRYMNPGLEVAGIVVTRLNRNSRAEVDMVEQIKSAASDLGTEVFAAQINFSDPITSARNRMTTVASADADPRWADALGTKAYVDLAREVAERLVA